LQRWVRREQRIIDGHAYPIEWIFRH
jgi:hypothetical protein